MCFKKRKEKKDEVSFPSKDGVQTPKRPKMPQLCSLASLWSLLHSSPGSPCTRQHRPACICLHTLHSPLFEFLCSCSFLKNASYHSPPPSRLLMIFKTSGSGVTSSRKASQIHLQLSLILPTTSTTIS